MYKMMRFIFVISFIFLLSLKSQAQTQNEAIGISSGINFHSMYYWMGQDFYGDNRAVVFPWVSFSKRGMNVMAMGELSPDFLFGETISIEKKWIGVDYLLSYKFDFFHGFLSSEIGMWYLWYPNDENEQRNISEIAVYNYDSFAVYVKLKLPKILLSPEIKYHHKYFLDDKDGTRSKTKDFYIRLTLNHSISLFEDVKLNLKLYANYFNYDSRAFKGISDVVFSCGLSALLKNRLKIYGNFNFALVPDKDMPFTGDGKDKTKYFMTTGVSYSM